MRLQDKKGIPGETLGPIFNGIGLWNCRGSNLNVMQNIQYCIK